MSNDMVEQCKAEHANAGTIWFCGKRKGHEGRHVWPYENPLVSLPREEAAALLDYLENHATYREPISALLQAAIKSLKEALKWEQT